LALYKSNRFYANNWILFIFEFLTPEMKHIQLFTALALLFFCQLAHSQNIDKIEYGEVDGFKGGGTINVVITKDSLFYKISGVKTKEKHIKTPKGVWDKLVTALPFDDFKKIKNGRTQTPKDGTDITISILKDKVNYVVFNGYDDPEHYQKIIPFLTYLQNDVVAKVIKKR
jgi:hypothetical protein